MLKQRDVLKLDVSEIGAFISQTRHHVRALLNPMRYALRVLGEAVDIDGLRADLLNKHHSIASDLRGKLTTLDALHLQLKYNYEPGEEQSRTLNSLTELRGYLNTKLNASVEYLQDMAKQHVPNDVATMFALIDAKLLPLLHKAGRPSSKLYVSVDAEGELVFTHYIQLFDFKDDSGFVHPEFCLAFTADLGTPGQYHAAGCSSLELPGSFGVGVPFTDITQAVDVIGDILDSENFSSLKVRLPLPVKRVTLNQLHSSGQWVSDVTVIDNEIQVKLAVGVGRSQVQEVVRNLTADIAGILSKFITGKLKFKTRWHGRQYMVKYSLIKPSEASAQLVTLQQLEALKDLGFDALDVQDLQKWLNRVR